MMPGTMNPFMAMAAKPASFVFNGSDEYLDKTVVSSSPNRKLFTVSFWLNYASKPGYLAEDSILVWRTDADNFSEIYYQGSPISAVAFAAKVGGSKTCAEAPAIDGVSTGEWVHYVIRVDTTAATGADRARIYRNGSERSPITEETIPAQNADLPIFVNGSAMTIGMRPGGSRYYDGKLAFIDVVEGASLPPTDFAFDNDGVWTRKPYAGSYGAHGFALHGSEGFADFTPYNMDAGNLDPNDLPPHTN